MESLHLNDNPLKKAVLKPCTILSAGRAPKPAGTLFREPSSEVPKPTALQPQTQEVEKAGAHDDGDQGADQPGSFEV